MTTVAVGASYPLTEPNNFGRDAAAYCDFKNRYGARNVDQVPRQCRAARIYHQRRSKARDAFEMAVPHHQHVHDSAEMPMHRTLENLVRRLIRRRQRMGEADPHPLDLEQMSDAHPCVGFEFEAMAIECFTTARAYGVEDAVLASLAETFPGINWEKQGAYFFQRVIEHGRRRSEEVREVAETVREIGLTPWSAQGTAERQAWVADLADEGLFGPKGSKEFARSPDWRTEADRILGKLNRGE